MKTGLITSDTYQNHNTGNGHPEKIDRVTAVIDNFKKLNNKNLIWKKPSNFDQSILIKTHSSEYINKVNQSFPKNGLTFLSNEYNIEDKNISIDSNSKIIWKGNGPFGHQHDVNILDDHKISILNNNSKLYIYF